MKSKPLLQMALVGVFLLVGMAACTFPEIETPTISPTRPTPMVYSDSVDSYLAVAPAAFRAGRAENVSVSLFDGSEPAQGTVLLELRRDNMRASRVETLVRGSRSIGLEVPANLPAGRYTLHMKGYDGDGQAFDDNATVQVTEPEGLLFLETDKPIYKPGQQIRIRALRLDSDLKPLPGPVEVSILDAKGIKVYKTTVEADEFGMADADLPLSTEPNLGVWKTTAESEERETQLDVRVEEYVLPKYEVSIDLPQDWALVDDAIAGTVSAEYSFGRPVWGEVEIVASRYVGVWEEYARFSGEIDGTTSFELPAVEYVAGVPASGGEGNLQLDVTVREPATGYEERVTRLLTITHSPIDLQVIPEGDVFKPGLPYSLLVVAENPGNEPVDVAFTATVVYYDRELDVISEETHDLATGVSGNALLELSPPGQAAQMFFGVETLGSARYGWTTYIDSAYSPSDNFIHVRQTGDAMLSVGDSATFRVHSTTPASRFYYEVIARGGVVFSDFTQSSEIAFSLTPAMTPEAKLVVYQILPDNEVAADYIPFSTPAAYPMAVEAVFTREEVRPGEAVDISVQTQGPAKVGLAAVDRSVFILAENRLNLRQVFAELERLYAEPQAEIHWHERDYEIETRGAAETFSDAGVVVLTNKAVPDGVGFVPHMEPTQTPAAMQAMPASAAPAWAESRSEPAADLAEVQRVRQFFPETWLWADVMTDDSGRAMLPLEAPDSITTWNLRAVGVSAEHGLGIANTELVVFQSFFLQVDLPYSAVRGEDFPVKVALYNYLDMPQAFHVEIAESDDFELLGDPAKNVTVAPNEVGGVEFDIRLAELGPTPIKITARSTEAADAVIRDLLVEPEGVAQEAVDNMILSAGETVDFDLAEPPGAIPGSNRAYAAFTGSYLAQTLDGLDNLLQMPYGCGEQNMILFAPNVFVARYLDATGQLKPEVMAKAEHLMTTGYQRELIYRRGDGSFSAFGESDDEGSLWLTAFVMKSFAQADGLIYIDEAVLRDAADWILSHQKSDGSFQPVGFLHHQELLGGLSGNTALTAYVAIALHEAGYHSDAAESIAFLEGRLDTIDDAYTLAIAAYALELAGSLRATDANSALLDLGTTDAEGLYWNGPASVETTGYALLALLEGSDLINSGNAARWLVSQRNAFGGYGSTQDTVVGLQALIEYATHAKFDVDMTVDITAGDWGKQVVINEDNADVVQIVELPESAEVQITAAGSGRVVAQVVHRFNMPQVVQPAVEMFQIDVEYGAKHLTVDDIIDITARFAFTPPAELSETSEAGMVTLDIAVPTGFAPIRDTVARLVEGHVEVKRYDIAGRKVILYLEDLAPHEPLELRFEAQARYPVRAQPVTSQVYSYYKPHWLAETLGSSVTVSGN